jgi:signal transduction histidine kinase
MYVHAISDGLIAASYYSIPFVLLTFAWRRRDLAFRWAFVMFGLFILACGTTHLLDVWTLTNPDYRLSGLVKALTAIISVTTAVALWPLLPKALALAAPAELRRVNADLSHQIAERQAAEGLVRSSNAALEERVSERTRALEMANLALRSEIVHSYAVERALRQAKEEAERAASGKARFFAAASHDLRQPIQAMFYFTQALSYRVSDDRSTAILADLDRSLRALKSLLDSLLDVSKLDAGTVEPQFADFPINDLLGRAAAEFSHLAADKGIDLRVVASSAWVRSDPALLGRVLQNLVANAVHYTNSGRVVVGCRLTDAQLRLQVIDTGVGIPDARLPEIFVEFTQLENPDRERGQGLGLGLAIVKRLCGLLQHGIAVRSAPGRGSIFEVSLPLSRALDRGGPSA